MKFDIKQKENPNKENYKKSDLDAAFSLATKVVKATLATVISTANTSGSQHK